MSQKTMTDIYFFTLANMFRNLYLKLQKDLSLSNNMFLQVVF